MKPSITIVTVTLNVANVLPRLIESLRAQTDRKFSHIVIDGASNDGTRDVIAAANDVVTQSISEPDRGVFDALNKALPLIRTDYYLVMGADDTLEPNAIANFRSVAECTTADVVIADVKAGNHIRRGYHPERHWRGPASMYTSHSVGTLLRTRLHQRFGEYSLLYPIIADSFYVKQLCQSRDVKIVAGDFVAGEFGMSGCSNRNFVRTLCELWCVQRDTNENAFLQYLLFQLRILRHFSKVVSRN